MRCLAKMTCRAALERTESRGSHFRTDYPAEDNQRWLKNIVLRKSNTGMNVEAKTIRLNLVELEV
jgi:succinate dehydrogenase/fumarate reductase flavoprotein subunit